MNRINDPLEVFRPTVTHESGDTQGKERSGGILVVRDIRTLARSSNYLYFMIFRVYRL